MPAVRASPSRSRGSAKSRSIWSRARRRWTSTSPGTRRAGARCSPTEEGPLLVTAEGRRRLVDQRGVVARAHGEAVDEVVHGVPGVALDPPEGHVATLLDQVDQRLPQVAVGHRLPGAALPAPGTP